MERGRDNPDEHDEGVTTFERPLSLLVIPLVISTMARRGLPQRGAVVLTRAVLWYLSFVG
jgi:hypothetical protein